MKKYFDLLSFSFLVYFFLKKENFKNTETTIKNILLQNETLFINDTIEDQTFIFELNKFGIKYYNKWTKELLYTRIIPGVFKMVFEKNYLNFYNEKNEIIDSIEIMSFNDKMIYLTINDGFIKISDNVNLNQFLINNLVS